MDIMHQTLVQKSFWGLSRVTHFEEFHGFFFLHWSLADGSGLSPQLVSGWGESWTYIFLMPELEL